MPTRGTNVPKTTSSPASSTTPGSHFQKIFSQKMILPGMLCRITLLPAV